MHNAAIIIKPKDLSVEESRRIFGDYLVRVDESDWYSEGDYRERLFANGKQVISVDAFITEFKSDWAGNDVWPIGILEGDYIDNQIIPHGFWEFHSVDSGLQGRLNELYLEAYTAWFDTYVGSMDDKENYEVVLLDYHN